MVGGRFECLVGQNVRLAGPSNLEWPGPGVLVGRGRPLVGESFPGRKGGQSRVRRGLPPGDARRRLDVPPSDWARAELSSCHRRGAGRSGSAANLGVPRLMNNLPLLTILTFLPLAGGLIIFGLGSEQRRLARGLALATSFVSLALALVLWNQFKPVSGNLQFEEKYAWISNQSPTSLVAQYHVGVDGLGLLMVLLTAVVVPMAMLASWKIQDRAPIYFGLVLLLQTGLFGTFTALNFFHWFIFWELSLIPAFFPIKLWGGPMRTPAATQFFVYTMIGSITLLLAFLAIFLVTHEFDFTELAKLGRDGSLIPALADHLGWRELTARRLSLLIFAGAFLGFAVKTPLVPFHTWLPPAYAEAPAGTTMLLTGLMSKMGVYGFLRILLPIFPQEMRWVSTPLLWLAVISIIYSASAAFAQRDLKRMLAYSSINHLGCCQ